MKLSTAPPKFCFYGHTNESLWAVVAGLNVTRKDRILAICGSGDQAFALSEFAREVVTVDRSKEQIAYAQRRLEALRDGRFGDFFPLFDDPAFPHIKDERFAEPRNDGDKLRYLHFMAAVKSTEPGRATWSGSVRYFLGEGIPFLEMPYGIFYDGERPFRIQRELHRVSFVHSTLEDVLRKDSNFSRVYLSNAISRWHANEDLRAILSSAECSLPSGCLLYMTGVRATTVCSLKGWTLEENLTRKAREAEKPRSWQPMVYEKE